MPQVDRTRVAALSLLATTVGITAVGIAALSRAGAGLCDRRLFVHHHAMAGGSAMTHPMAVASAPADGICPILLYAALVVAALCLFTVGAVLAAVRRPEVSDVRARQGSDALAARLRAVVSSAARFVLELKLGRTTGLLAVGGALPLGAMLATEAGARLSGPAALAGLAVLAAAAVLGALALLGLARAVLASARRFWAVLAAAFRLLAPGADAPWVRRLAPVHISAGVRLARRRSPRAPPI